jgi:hypothetical protein
MVGKDSDGAADMTKLNPLSGLYHLMRRPEGLPSCRPPRRISEIKGWWLVGSRRRAADSTEVDQR